MSTAFKLEGQHEIVRQLKSFSKAYREKVAAALYKQANVIMTKSKRDHCPVDTGALRASGIVREPEFRDGAITVALEYGGPGAEYALIVHENLDASHSVGEAKYLERPLMEAVATLPRELAKDLKL